MGLSCAKLRPLRGNLQKKNSIFKDIIQIEVDHPPFHPIFDKFIFDKVLAMLTSLPPLEFLTKIMTFWASNLHSLLSLLLSKSQGYRQKDTEPLGLARLSNKSYKIEYFYF